MNKFKMILIIGIALFVAGVAVIAAGFSAAGGEENSLTFSRTVSAEITNTRIDEPETSRRENGIAHLNVDTTYTYYVEFLVSDSGSTYKVEQVVPPSLYNEYCALEKNKSMEFNLYFNADGAVFLSLKDLDGAEEDYQSEHVTKAIAVQMIGGLIVAAVGWVLITTGANGAKSMKDRD